MSERIDSMDYIECLAISYYQTIATLNEEHKIFLVQHQDTKKIYIKKLLDIYNINVYRQLKSSQIKGIPKLYELYEENKQLTIIEEYISGSPLQELIDKHELSSDLIIRYLVELCTVLESLHSFNPPIIHRDIKPSNIIITPHGELILIDFNAAKQLTNKYATDTILLGTQGYAAPEQYGFGSSTPQTDIYAIGILLKELVESLPSPTSTFDSLIWQCTQMNPKDRFSNVTVLKTALLQLSDPLITVNNTTETDKEAQMNIPVFSNLKTTSKLPAKDFLPPGYRTRTPWKMLTTSLSYLIIFMLSSALTVEDASKAQTWMERFFFFMISLSIVACTFNYMDIQRCMPLCKSKILTIRYTGIILLNFLVSTGLIILMLLITSIFF